MNNLPPDLTNLFSLSSEVHTTNLDLNSARKNLLHISKINTKTYGNKSIKHHCATLWNETFRNGIAINSYPHKNLLVTDIRSSHFKRVLKKHYLFNYSLDDNWMWLCIIAQYLFIIVNFSSLKYEIVFSYFLVRQ